MQKKERNTSIDLLRTIAITSIIHFHFAYAYTYQGYLREIGFFGISLFFIISGYLLTYKYPDLEKFSIKWFWKRYVKIASLYYLGLITIILMFTNQSYTGSLWKNLITHIFFIDFYFTDTAYGIMSAAWFLIPLMGMYILFPYLNKLIKKRSYLLIIIMIAMVLFRMNRDGLTSFNLLFFLGEFCFGIALAHNKKDIFLLTPLLVILIEWFMIFPFITFYVIHLLNLNFLPQKILRFIGKNTLPLFLFHEAILKVWTEEWHLYTLNKYSAAFLLIVISVFLTYTSSKIQNFITPKNLSKQENKDKLGKTRKNE